MILKTNINNDRIGQRTIICHIILLDFCNDMKYTPVKNSSFLYEEDVIICTSFFVNVIGRKRQECFSFTSQNKRSKEPLK